MIIAIHQLFTVAPHGRRATPAHGPRPHAPLARRASASRLLALKGRLSCLPPSSCYPLMFLPFPTLYFPFPLPSFLRQRLRHAPRIALAMVHLEVLPPPAPPRLASVCFPGARVEAKDRGDAAVRNGATGAPCFTRLVCACEVPAAFVALVSLLLRSPPSFHCLWCHCLFLHYPLFH